MNKPFTRKTHVKRIKAAISGIGLCLLMLTTPCLAQQSVADNFDTKKAIGLKGTIIGVLVPPRVPVCILIDVESAGGKPQRWVIEGDVIGKLRQAGWTFFSPSDTLRLGETIAVSAYLPKPGSKAADVLSEASPQLADELKTARLAHGTEVTLPSGKKLPFGARQ